MSLLYEEYFVDGKLIMPAPPPAYIAPEENEGLSADLVDFEHFLLDEFGERALYEHLLDIADELRLEEEERKKREMEAEELASVISDTSSSSECGPKRSPRSSRSKAKPYTRPASEEAEHEDFVEFFTINKKYYYKKPLGENEYYVHCVDWHNNPPTWDNEPIPPMPIHELVPYLQEKYGIAQSSRCKLSGCTESSHGKGWLKNHLLSYSHFKLRRKCHICGVTARPDMWTIRHRNCQPRRRRHGEAPDLPIPTYTY
ncbi:hypothetical protein BD311DRAFT_298012 [Dichomitus squalens]|uniref:Uncharacterized protein n=1 Tax=Dichomitus squalens TaxID=114155 RepID=A0A4Q9MQ68_9APHY|nr:hypothetical protein BD311DRAFT_298012 [Dichomitus squalens]